MDIYKFYAESIDNILDSKDNFIKFNETAGRVYRYPFHDQILIFAQKPEAKAVAGKDIWIGKMNRHIKNGAVAIALTDRNDEYNGIRYVYDESDTEKNIDRNGNITGKDVPLWNITPENEHVIFSDKDGNLKQRIMASVFSSIDENMCRDVCSSIERIGGQADYNTVRTVLIAMTLIQTASRCGLSDDTYRSIPIDMNAVSPTIFMYAGEKASEVSEKLLRKVYFATIEYNKSLRERENANVSENNRRDNTSIGNREPKNDRDNEVKGEVLNGKSSDGLQLSSDDRKTAGRTTENIGRGSEFIAADNSSSNNNRGSVSESEPLPVDNIEEEPVKEINASIEKAIESSEIKENISKKPITDFGEHIGGARKELYGSYVNFEDLDNMNLEEQMKAASKNKIWPKRDWEEEIKNGFDPAIAYWQNEIRKLFPAKPKFSSSATVEDKARIIKRYVEIACILRDDLLTNCNTREGCEGLMSRIFDKDGSFDITEGANHGFTMKRRYGVQGVYMDKDFIIPDKLFFTVDFDGVFYHGKTNWAKFEVLVKKELFGIPADRKIYQQIVNDAYILKNIEGTLTSEKDFRDRILFKVKTGGGTYFVYPENKGYFEKNPELKDISSYKKDTYFVYGNVGDSNGQYILPNFNTREEAKEGLEKFAESFQSLHNKLVEKEKEEKQSNKTEKKTTRTAPVRNVIREGCDDVRQGKDITGDDYLNDFGFRGGEFGNWNSNKERQDCLNAGYEACIDLAKVLNITPDSISLGNKLAIAFGARGKGRALAHFESLRNVINLTKMKGAGSLAHEWGHALDAYLGKVFNVENPELSCFLTLATDNTKGNIPEELSNVCDVMQYRIKHPEERLSELRDEIYNKAIFAFRMLERDDGKLFIDVIEKDPEKQKIFNDAVNSFIDNNIDKDIPFMAFYAYREPGRNKLKYGEEYTPVTELKNKFIEIGGGNPEEYKVDYREESDYDLGKLTETYKSFKYIKEHPKDIKVKTNFFESALTQRNPKYYASPNEMFARAFSLYIKEKMNALGMRNTYLTRETGDENDPLIPHGKEKEDIFNKFDEIFDYCREHDLLKSSEKEVEISKE